MSDIPETGTADAAAAPKVTSRVMAQYVRDLSFENILAQKGVSGDAQPEISVQVNLDARKRGAENQYEVITKLNITSKTKEKGDPLFLLEIDYAGIFHVEGIPEEQMHPYLLIECPRITFPFLRRIVSDVTRDGGFPPLNLETIDFLQLYRSELARRAEAEKDKKQPVN
ncbi:protein translocase subunit secB [Cognatiyoonia koreensis]|uniref:Protein-export protein SecB n=1 Tax=Cognatiyoonia koreensis TaxID=364200 RepID=A0A1I0RR40_9RHOB|nr:protein-export chaperone SecB [Cognatiyoonia koreensis]SEW43228.1 protein translocase subunit secB [Cognatiyoonia koreensis]